MSISHYLAALWGITIAVVSTVLLIHPSRLEKLLKASSGEGGMFYGGIVTFVVGLCMVMAHNLWVPDWRLSITLLGWLSLLKGLDMLFLPKRMKLRWAKTENKYWGFIFILMMVLGLLLTYLAFGTD